MKKDLISVVIPSYNEELNVERFYAELTAVLKRIKSNYELVYVNDGSRDNTLDKLSTLARHDKNVRIINLSRNFGKEVATTAGIHAALGQAIIIIDADGQHPVELIPEFVRHWQAGAKVVVGIRTSNQKEGMVKRYGSKMFYRLFNRVTDIKMVPGSTDYRLIDKVVQQDFMRLTERNRITRSLIDWLGYRREYIEFVANPRMAGEATYSFKKLVQLAIDSIISNSTSPLYIAAYLGAAITPLSLVSFFVMAIDSLAGDPLNIHATGSAYGIVLVLFLVGILLISQGIIGLYLSHIHTETKNRPLYLVDTD